MDNLEDVERLFSWLKAPMVHYREFAPQREIAEAVATWPVAHRAAVQTAVAAADEPAPLGDTAAKERISRDRRSLATAMAATVHAPTISVGGETEGEGAAEPVSRDRLVAELGERVQTAHAAPTERAAGAAQPEAGAPAVEGGAATITGFDEPAAAAAAPEAGERERGGPAQYYPAAEREALFAGEYRGRGREAQPGSRSDRRDRSLDAVFTRLSGTRERLPDPRARARTSPGLGPVFGRLR